MLPKRKKLRLSGYDYSSSGCYFVTICTHNNLNLFWTNGLLNSFGRIVESQIEKIEERYWDVKIDKYVIMPNHIHMLVTIGCDALPDDDEILLQETLGEIKHSNLEGIIGLLKSGVTREIHRINNKIKVWQRSYFDHIIRNEKDYNETWDYIEANPIRWEIKNGSFRAGQDPAPTAKMDAEKP